jgi:hypothetical protein
MTNHIQKTLQYSDDWIRLGIITLTEEAKLWQEYCRGEDTRPEHYRWGAFTRYLSRHNDLPETILLELYRLGEIDPDYGMGGAMMDEILCRPECPTALLKLTLESDRKHLVRTANRILTSRKEI